MDAGSSPSRYRDPRRELLPFVPAGVSSVLDVGCAEGAFDAELRRLQPDLRIVGLDPTVSAGELDPGVFDRFVTGRYPDDVPADEDFDCVFFNDVLEHLEDPWSALCSVDRVLADGGHVVASIPNVRHLSVVWSLLVRGRFEYRDTGILDRTHLRFFTRRSMLELFDSAGLEVLRVEPVMLVVTGWPTPRPTTERARIARGVAKRFVQRFGPRFPELFARQYVVVAHRPGCPCPR